MSRDEFRQQHIDSLININRIQMDLFLHLIDTLDEIFVMKKAEARGDVLMEYNLTAAVIKARQKLEHDLNSIRKELDMAEIHLIMATLPEEHFSSVEELVRQEHIHRIQIDLVLDLIDKLDEMYVMKKAEAGGDALTELNLSAAVNKVQKKLEHDLNSARSELAMGEIHVMMVWFSKLPEENRKNLSTACSWYSFHLDTYLNSIYRKRVYPINKLLNHADELYDEKNHRVWIYSVTTFSNEQCHPDIIISPFRELIGREHFLLSEYIQFIYQATHFIHDVFRHNYYTLVGDMTVYRGIRLLKTQEALSLRVDGITSCSTELEQAIYFAYAFFDLENPEDIDLSIYNFIVFEIKIPAGTRVIPMNICTLQDEDELAILSQGHLEIDEQLDIQLDISSTDTYTLYKTRFVKDKDEPEYGTFDVSKEVGIATTHVMNDLPSQGKSCRKKKRHKRSRKHSLKK